MSRGRILLTFLAGLMLSSNAHVLLAAPDQPLDAAHKRDGVREFGRHGKTGRAVTSAASELVEKQPVVRELRQRFPEARLVFSETNKPPNQSFELVVEGPWPRC